MFWFFVIALLTLIYFWLRHRYSYWERRGVPGPKPFYLLGNMLQYFTFQVHRGEIYQQWHNTYKNVPYLGFYNFLRPAVLIRDPDLQRQILVKAFASFKQNDTAVSKDDLMLKENPFFLKGEEWRHNRSVFAAGLSANRIKPLFPKMVDVCREWERYVLSLGPNAEIDGKEIYSRLTTATMLRCAFSIDGKTFEQQSEFIDMGKSAFKYDIKKAMMLALGPVLPALLKITNFTILPKLVDQRFREIIRHQIKLRDSESVQCVDVLQFLLNSRDKLEMTENQIAGVFITFFIEFNEVLSNMLSMASYMLAKNPHIQNELAHRIEESLEANNNEITYDLVHKHEYLDRVAAECMRIKPSAADVRKLCTKAYTMPLIPGQSEPTTIPAGMTVVLPLNTVYQDPVYYPDPDYFDPERFSPEQKAQRSKSTFMPFTDGPRICSGFHMASFSFKVILFQTIRSFDIKLHPSNKPIRWHPTAFFMVPRDGIKLIFTPRKAI